MKLCHLVPFASAVLSILPAIASIAQIIPDRTLGSESSVVNQIDVLRQTIDGGAVRGSNLFHSFQEFSVPTGGEAFFNNGGAIDNIITRVTGGSLSNIDGLIRANGSANLFLLNPNGIIFGPNARLDIGGSFFGTTADRFIFEDGSFYSASNPQTSPLLTVNVPIGVQFGATPGSIQVEGTGHNLTLDPELFIPIRENRPVGLSVSTSRTLALVGGEVSLTGGNLTAPSGRVELGSVEQGTVSITPTARGWELDYAGIENFADISLTQEASVDTSGGNSQVQLAGRNIFLTDSSVVVSNTLGEVDGGTFTVRATESLELTDNDGNAEFPTILFNLVEPTATGNGGNSIIETGRLLMADGARISASTFGKGKAGQLAVRAAQVEAIGTTADGFPSGLFVDTFSTGDGGLLTIDAESLILRDGAQIGSGTFGEGNAGQLAVRSDQIEAIGRSALGPSGLFTTTLSTGDGGLLTIDAESLILRDGARIEAVTFEEGKAGQLAVRSVRIELIGQSADGRSPSGLTTATVSTGDGGLLTIDAESLILRDGARIEVNTFGEGSAGQLRVRSARIELIGTDAAGFPSGLFTDTVSTGDGGLLTIDAENLILRDGAQIVAGTSGEGNAGQLGVRSVRIELIGTSADGRSTSGLTTGTDSTGDGGLLMIDAESLILRDGAVIGSGTFGEGNAGQLGVRSDRIELIGTDAAGFPSGLFTFTSRGSTGDGGLLTIDANSLILHDGAVIQATTFGEGNAGEIGVRSDQIELMGTTADGLSSGLSTGTRSTGDGGLLTIDTESLILRDGAVISAETSGEGNAGQLRVRSDRIELIGTSVDGQFLSSLLTLSEGEGDANTLTVEAEDILLDNGRISAETEVSSQGAIELFVSDSLTLRNNAAITTSTENGVGGNLTIRADEVTLNSGSILNTEATGERGSAGSMFITADQLRLNNSALNADTFNTIGDARGNIILNTSALSLENSSNIRTNATGSEAIGGNITITSDVLTAVENSNITANAPAGAGGNITIDSDAIAALENSDITTNAAGQGGLITINTQGRFGLEQRSREELQTLLGLEEGQLTVDSPNQLPSSDITAISLQSPDLDGQVFFNEPDIDPSRGLIPLPADIVEVAEPSQGCQVTGQTGTGELFETGRGGLVPDPLQLLNSDATWDDIRDPSSIRGNTPSTATIPQPTAKNQRRTIIEAQSLEITANGDIKLTAPPFSTTSYQPLLHQNGCQPSVKNKNLSSPKAPEITVRQFEFIGNTVIPSEKLAEIAQTFTNKPLTFDQLLAARSEVSKFYINSGYITSGAIIPPQTSRDGVVTVEVIEGTLEDIKIATSGRLNPSYIRSRLNIEPSQPVNKNHLVKVLQLLQLDPIIERISAELSTGLSPGTSLLEVNVTEVPSFNGLLSFDNGRSPSVGSFQRGVRLGQTNLLGLGDTLSLEYNNSEGSNAWDVRYALPINSSNGTIQFNYSNASSNVVEPPFDLVDIEANSRTYELSYRQPIVRTVSNTLVEELAVGLRANHRESQTFLLGEDFPLSAGADENGETRVSALRFFQDWTQRGDRQVFAARSEFSLGVGLFDATVNDNEPDSQFLSWRGQGLWARLLAPDTKLIVRGDVQLSAGELLPLEQFGVGGLESVRGYRQDALLTDNGVLLSAEFEFPIFRSPKRQTIVQLIPFIDVGAGWNSDGNANPDRNVLLSTGLGLQLQLGKGLTARLDWGIPLVDIESRDRTWQENGLHFSLETRPF